MTRNFLLIEPEFPIPPKSKNHKNFLPIGLLKIASYLVDKGDCVKLIRGFPEELEEITELERCNPDEVWITSLFTYWSDYVRSSVVYYKNMFPDAKVVVGGIYATLMTKHCKESTGCDEVHPGIFMEAEDYYPMYELVDNNNPNPLDYQIINSSRGCIRKCAFCGTWKIVKKFKAKDTIKGGIRKSKIVFYDDNFLANPNVGNILGELIELKKNKEIIWCESQSGFDGRKLEEDHRLGNMIKNAGFRYPRIAWDGLYDEYKTIKGQIDILIDGGYTPKDIFVFMLYNWDIGFREMEKKRLKCWNWKVQIADCRYRPLNQTFDNYYPGKRGQTNDDYYIHEQSGWTDGLIKRFRKNVRQQNICVRHGFPFYSKDFEHKKIKSSITKNTKRLKTKEDKKKYLKRNKISFWFPR